MVLRSAHQGHLVQGTGITNLFPDCILVLRPLLISKDYMAENQSAQQCFSAEEIPPYGTLGDCQGMDCHNGHLVGRPGLLLRILPWMALHHENYLS